MGRKDKGELNPLQKWHKQQKKREKEKRKHEHSANLFSKSKVYHSNVPESSSTSGNDNNNSRTGTQAKLQKELQRLNELYQLGQLDSLGQQKMKSLDTQLSAFIQMKSEIGKEKHIHTLPPLPNEKVPIFMVDGTILEPEVPAEDTFDDHKITSFAKTEYSAAPQIIHQTLTKSNVLASNAQSTFIPVAVRKRAQKKKEDLQAAYLDYKRDLGDIL